MNDQIVLYKKNHQKNIENYCNRNEKRLKVTKNPNSYLRQTLYLLNPLLSKQHNAQAYFLTITFPKANTHLIHQWKLAVQSLQEIKKEISKQYLVVAGIISIEPHKNTTLKNKKGTNTKAGSPHFHAVLWITHDFLNPDMVFLRTYFNFKKLIVKINKLKTDVDAMKAILYTIKDQHEHDVKNLCKDFTLWQSNINIWINHIDVKEIFLNVQYAADNRFFVTQEIYSLLPTTRFHDDKALLLTELFTKLFRLKKLAVREGFVYERKQNTQFSWQRTIPLKNWIANTFTEKAPVKYLAMLKEHANWIAAQGKTFKTGINYELFPKLKLQFFLVEFLDKVYEFKNGKTYSFDEIDFEINSVCHVPKTFDEIEPPLFTLSLLFALINYGRDETMKVQNIKQIPNEQHDGTQIGSIRHWDKAWEISMLALAAIGGLYHFDEHRKQNKTIFLTGEPNTYKTTILKTILDKLIGLHHVDIISRTSNKFNLGNLRKDQDAPYILVMDDLRWEHLGLNTPDFTNLLDGDFVYTEQKYLAPTQGKIKGNIAITSNQSLYIDERPFIDTKALKERILEVNFYPLQKHIFQNENIVENLNKEAIAFSVLTNIIFLRKNIHLDSQLDIPKTFLTFKNFKHKHPPLTKNETTGLFLFNKIMQQLNL